MTPKGFPALKGTIFIVTYGRSGSTLLQSMLQTIPDAHITGENNNTLEGLFRAGERARESRRVWGRKPYAKDHPWHGANKINPDLFEKKLAEVFTDFIIQPPPDARWFGFKEIRYPRLGADFPEFLKFCQRNFHNAFFVFNSRKGEDVANSKWWADQPRENVLKLVINTDRRFASFAKANPEISHHVFHENTLADPASLQPLFDKLGETLDLEVARNILNKPLTH